MAALESHRASLEYHMLEAIPCNDPCSSSSPHWILSLQVYFRSRCSEKAQASFQKEKEEGALLFSVIHVPKSGFYGHLDFGSI